MTKPRKLSKQQEEKFFINKNWLYKKYYIEELSLKEIKVLIGCSEVTIRRRLKKFNFKLKKIKRLPLTEEAKKLLSLKYKILIDKDWLYNKYYIEFLSVKQIAKLLNISGPTVNARMIEFGLKRRNRSEAKQGILNPSYGKPGFWKDKKRDSKEYIEKLKKVMPKGEKHFRYKKPEERIDPINSQIRNCQKSKEWKRSVLIRDNFKCKMCNSNKKLHVDHIKPFALIKAENNISTLEKALLCDKLWDINNGRTLCSVCHKSSDTWAAKTSNILKEKGFIK